MYMKQVDDRTRLHRQLKGHQKTITPSQVIPSGSSIFLRNTIQLYNYTIQLYNILQYFS